MDYPFEEIIKDSIVSLSPLNGGRNSRVYKIETKNSGIVVLKFYHQHPSDTRSRMHTEFQALMELRQAKIITVPEPLYTNTTYNCAAYRYIEHISYNQISNYDLDCALDLMRSLKQLATVTPSDKFLSASEACFSFNELIASLERRLSIIRNVPKAQNPAQTELEDFWSKSFNDTYAQILRWVKIGLSPNKIDINQSITPSQKTLSSSDFGFHNALKTPQNTWVFQDFEYFGWDDPSKLMADFILHPAMKLSAELKKYFIQEALRIYVGTDPCITARLRLQYPLWGIKWCLILLNEFVPEHRARRGFAGVLSDAEIAQRQLLQLTKAQVMLDTVCNTYEQFDRNYF